MSTPFRSQSSVRFGRVLLVVGLCAMLGLHWVALQTLAWTQMLVTYTQAESFSQAVKKTFDGEHPCDLCKLVRTGKSEEKKPSYSAHHFKSEAVLPKRAHLTPPLPELQEYPSMVCMSAVRGDVPPTPPPKV